MLSVTGDQQRPSPAMWQLRQIRLENAALSRRHHGVSTSHGCCCSTVASGNSVLHCPACPLAHLHQGFITSFLLYKLFV